MLAATFSKYLPKPGSPSIATWRLLLPLAVLHLAMLGYDAAHPDRFLRADRADERMQIILGLPGAAAKGETLSYIAGHGVAGDWLPQGLIYLAGGPYALIVVQVVLALLSIVWVRDIGRWAGLDEKRASLAASIYALLPHTLVFPHQLASEALFVPLVILGFRATGWRSGLALGLATLVRPLAILWPFAQAAVLRPSSTARTLLLVAAFAPVLGWMTFELAKTGEFSMGRSSHDLGRNLYARVGRMAASLPEQERLAAQPAGVRSLSVGEYLGFVIAHPLSAAMHSGRDIAALGFKSGIERLTLDYLDFFPAERDYVQDSRGGWRVTAEQLGVLGTVQELARRAPFLIATSAAAGVLFVLFMLLAATGAWRSFQERHVHRLLLALFVLYIFVTAQAVDAAQSRHRAPAEFALCLLAVAGWAAVRRRLEKHRVYVYRPTLISAG